MPRDSSGSTAGQEQGKQPATTPAARRDWAAIAAWILGLSFVTIALKTQHEFTYGLSFSTPMAVVAGVGQVGALTAAALGVVALLGGSRRRRLAWMCLLGGIALVAWTWCGPIPEPVIVR